jgi:hypothetical protein
MINYNANFSDDEKAKAEMAFYRRTIKGACEMVQSVLKEGEVDDNLEFMKDYYNRLAQEESEMVPSGINEGDGGDKDGRAERIEDLESLFRDMDQRIAQKLKDLESERLNSARSGSIKSSDESNFEELPVPQEGQRGKHRGTGEPLEYRNGRWQRIGEVDPVEFEPGKWRSADVVEYNSMLTPMVAFLCLIDDKFIGLNPATGEAFQLRDFRTGRDLEKPVRVVTVRKGDYYYLRVILPCSYTKSKIIRIRVLFHHLVYIQVHGEIPHGCEIHHKNGFTWDNSISNLVALTPQSHAKIGKQTNGSLKL